MEKTLLWQKSEINYIQITDTSKKINIFFMDAKNYAQGTNIHKIPASSLQLPIFWLIWWKMMKKHHLITKFDTKQIWWYFLGTKWIDSSQFASQNSMLWEFGKNNTQKSRNTQIPHLGETIFLVLCPLHNRPQKPIFKSGYCKWYIGINIMYIT